MKPWHLGFGILALCLVDCAATQREWLAFKGVEGNPLMAWVIGSWGWSAVWAVKLALGMALLLIAGPFYRYHIGRLLLWFTLAVYGVICGLHSIIFFNS